MVDRVGNLDPERGGILKKMCEQSKRPAPKDRDSIVVPEPEVIVVDKYDELYNMLERILFRGETLLAIDLEGINLGRVGTLSILSIYSPAWNIVYLVDVVTLGRAAFTTLLTTAPSDLLSLKDILESDSVKKLIFDCRGDSDALFNLYQIELGGVLDLQLFDLATRYTPKERMKVLSLSHVLQQRVKISDNDKTRWRNAKDWGSMIYLASIDEVNEMYETCGGRFAKRDLQLLSDRNPDDIFRDSKDYQKEWLETRPMEKLVIEYCVGDVILLPAMYEHFLQHHLWNDEWATRVEEETKKRLADSKAEDFDRTREKMLEAPAGWDKIEQTLTCSSKS